MAEYRYRDDQLDIVWTSTTHLSDKTAISFVSTVNIMSRNEVAYVEVKRNEGDQFTVLCKVKDLKRREQSGEPAQP